MSKFRTPNKKGVALIIVVSAMILFAILGWTLAIMLSSSFEVNLRNLESENALYIAEAGIQWGLNQLWADPSWRTSTDDDCLDATDWITHSLFPGQYRVCCRNATSEEEGVVIISGGFVPSQTNYRATRLVKVEVSFGTIDKAVNCRYLFDWSAMDSGSYINGDIVVTDRPDPITGDGYEGNGSLPHNQEVDFAVPDTCPEDKHFSRETSPNDNSFLKIDMAQMEQEIADENPSRVWSPARAGKIASIQTVAGKSIITFESDFFDTPYSSFDGQRLRNTTMGSFQIGSWAEIDTGGVLDRRTVRLTTVVNWNVGDNIYLLPMISSISLYGGNWSTRTYQISFTCNIPMSVGNAVTNFSKGGNRWSYTNWGVITYVSSGAGATTIRVNFDNSVGSPPNWTVGEYLGEVRRFSANANSQLWYLKGDLLFDARNGNANFQMSSFITEGDIGLVGQGFLRFRAHNRRSANQTYPNIATENGNIFSSAHQPFFDGLVYAAGEINAIMNNQATGNVYFIDGIDGVSIYGYNITLDGLCRLTFDTCQRKGPSKWTDEDAFFPCLAGFSWREISQIQ
ncbi:MAG: hypothetical protein NC912_01475 [Candidatus Omnitrophica bacterium]|nr:hypothetical protein [Candidatus Omnitrophota bacterium]